MENIKLSELETNSGQLKGLPRNPRKVRRDELEKLKENIRRYPEMLQYRGLIVAPLSTGRYVVIAGNTRYKALKELGYTEAPCFILDKGTPTERMRAYAILDNYAAGEWDADILKTDWDENELREWETAATFADIAKIDRKGWGQAAGYVPPYCGMEAETRMYGMRDMRYFCSFKKNDELMGKPIAELKTVEYVQVFASAAVNIIREVIGLTSAEGWALVTPPKRRHQGWNFSEQVAESIAAMTGIHYYKDAIRAKNRQRIEPEFALITTPDETNMVIYDDIITTGSTILATRELFPKKNILIVGGIRNA